MVADELRDVYDNLIQFASAGERAVALTGARERFIARTGELFESDEAFERRICAFLEWYTLDCVTPTGDTLLAAYAKSLAQEAKVRQAKALSAWQHASLSLYALTKLRPDSCVLDDLLLSQRHTVPRGPQLLGLPAGALLVARVVVHDDVPQLTDGVSYFPQAARRVLLRLAKSYRKGRVPGVSRLDLLHRLIYLSNRCERYKHVDPKRIFQEGEAQVTAPSLPEA
jgi:hypothetical protein